jgi:general secretion pathway protein F/type IV pilus assembly protein PilC
MPQFSYVARRLDGARVTGTLTAPTERDAVNSLTGQSLFPVEVTAAAPAKSLGFGRRLGAQTMATFYSQLASLMRSGVPLLKSLRVLQEQTSKPRLAAILDDVAARVEEGTSVGDALARHPRTFNDIAVNMARAGSEGGFLEDALDRVAQFTEHQADLRARTVGALVYPIVLAVIGTLIVTVLIVFFIPKFGELFDTLRSRGELPFLTDWLLGFSNWIRDYGVFFAIGAAILLVVAKVQLNTAQGRRAVDLVKLRLPVFGTIFRNLAVARFCRVLGTLLRNGVPILKSLDISRLAAGNAVLADAISQAAEQVTSGESLADPLGRSGHFPLNVTEMIAVAEESNTLDSVLVNIADGLEKQTGRRLDLLVRLLEPAMLMVMAGIILVIVIALLMPVMKMGTALQ